MMDKQRIKNDKNMKSETQTIASTNNEKAKLFDPSHLRLSQNFSETVGVKKALVTVPVRKPNRQDFIRVHPSSDYRLETAVLELKEERETYLVDQFCGQNCPAS